MTDEEKRSQQNELNEDVRKSLTHERPKPDSEPPKNREKPSQGSNNSDKND